MKLGDLRSIVGIDPTDRGLAFVSFERGNLLDWGTRRDDGNELGLLDRLLQGCAADVVVIEDGDAPKCLRRPRIRALLRKMELHARGRGIQVVKVARDDVRREWAATGRNAKTVVAAAIAGIYPELEVILPRPRKFYRSEEARVQIFDAVSLVLHAFTDREREYAA